MPVLVNFKICDNAPECNGITACKSGALSWDAKRQTIAIDNSKCASCGACVCCPVNAIVVAKDDAEYEKLKKEISDDPRRRSDLYIDRYGAQPIHPGFLTKPKDFPAQILRARGIAAAEFFSDDSVRCMLHSIPVKKLLNEKIKFRKVKVAAGHPLLEKYGIKKLPALVFFRDGEMIGKIEGYYQTSDISKVRSLIEKIIPAGKRTDKSAR